VPKGGLEFDGELSAAGARIAVVVARFNAHITERLLEGCIDELRSHGAREGDVTTRQVPGCFELPIVAKAIAAAGQADAIICLGAIIRGETPHFEYVSQATAIGIQRAALDTGVPVVFGVLTTDDDAQALARAGGEAGHKGREAALTAIEMAQVMRGLRSAPARAM
jgi:6,7-dimethyl-8-ribityllumazine synthase